MKRKRWMGMTLTLVVVVGIGYLIFGRTSRLLWEASVPGGGYVFAMDDKAAIMDGTLYLLGPKGATKTLFRSPMNLPFARMTRDSGILTLSRQTSSADGMKLVCLDLNGKERWRFEEANVRGIPEVAEDGSILFLASDSNLYFLEPDGGFRSRLMVEASRFQLHHNLGVVFDRFTNLIKVFDLDGHVVLKFFSPTPQESPTAAIDSLTNVFVAWASNLARFNSDGERAWTRSLPVLRTEAFDTNSPVPSAAEVSQISIDEEGHAFCHTFGGYLHAYDFSGKLLWSHPVGTWATMDFSPHGDLVVVGEDAPRQWAPTFGSASPVSRQISARNDRVMSFSADTGLIWEQALPVKTPWHLPRSRVDAWTLWRNLRGYHESRGFFKPLILPGGTVVVMASSLFATNASVYAIRGDLTKE